MRVLHLTTEFPPIIYGGLGTAVGGMVKASARAGITVGVLLAGHAGHGAYDPSLMSSHGGVDRVQAVTHDQGATIFYVPSSSPIETGVSIVRLWKPDVVHLHVFWLWPVAHAIQERTGVPLIYHVHSLDKAEYDLGHGPPECLTQWNIQEDAISTSDRVIALTRSESDLVAEYCPSTRGRVRIIGNGIDDSAAARRAVHKDRHTDSPLVLYTGRFVERKGVRELIAAIPHVLEHAPQTRFVLAGGHRHCSGEEMAHWWLPSELQRYRSRIHFTGWLTPEQLNQWYAAADVLVVPSWYEPFGMVVLEGMLYGLPIVAADVGGPSEILEDGRTGILVPAKDVEALAQGITRLVLDQDLRRQVGTAAADAVRRDWLWQHVVGQMQNIYREAARPRPAAC